MNTAFREKLEAREEHNDILRELAQKITRTSLESTDEIVVKETPVRHVKKDYYTVAVSSTGEQMNVLDLKSDIKNVCKTKEDSSIPSDEIITKVGRVALKLGTQKEAEDMNKSS